MFFSANIPFKQEEVEDYEQKRYRGLDQRIVHRMEVRRLRKTLRKTGLGSRPDKTSRSWILDAPCGYGRFSPLLQRLGLRLVNSDLSLPMVKRACERNLALDSAFGVVTDMKRGLPFKSGVFEALFSIRFFHHLHREDERREVLREFSRVSSRWVILTFYKMNVFHSLQRRLRRALKKSQTRIKMIPGSLFVKEIEAVGFRLVCSLPLLRGVHAYHIVLLEKL